MAPTAGHDVEKKRTKEKLMKTYTMPTWAATKSLLQSGRVNHTNANQIEPKVAGMDAGELAQLHETSSVPIAHHQCMPSGDWEAYLAALDDQIQYFYAHDLFHYARLMPVHLAQMNQLENDDPITWNALKEGNFCAKNLTRLSLHYLQIKLLSRRSMS